MSKFAVLSVIMLVCTVFSLAGAETIEKAQRRREKNLELREAEFHAELKQRHDKVAATLHSHSKPSYKATNPDDIQALKALYSSTKGDKWNNNTGWLKGDPCGNPFWYGIYCINGRVLQINLVDNQLDGKIPAELAKASALQVVRFYSNFLTGSIPEEIFTMQSLQIFDANNNQLSGELPSTISMANLTDLVLYANKIFGELPSFNSPMLQTLELSSNQFTGQLSDGLSQNTGLKELVVSRNMLTGTLPSSYGAFRKMQRLWTFYNNFNRPTIPDSWRSMTAMQEVQADQLYGPMPDWLGDWRDLQLLILVNGGLTGNFPSSICDSTKLQIFRIFNNSLTGQVPRCICTFPALTDIEISDNQFTGPVPDCIGQVTSLVSIFFSRNNFSGEFPSSVGGLVHLETLDVSSNDMCGTIPNSINNLNVEIAEFAISYNKFSTIQDGMEDFFNRIKDYGCEFYGNPWSCPLPSEVPKECGAQCSKCNSGAMHSDCNSCIKQDGCGWCNECPNCLEGQSSGPYQIYHCQEWTYGSNNCP